MSKIEELIKAEEDLDVKDNLEKINLCIHHINNQQQAEIQQTCKQL